MSRNLRISGFIGVLFVLFLSGIASGDLVTNGDFEDGFTNGVANGWSSFSASGYSPTFSDGTEHVRNGLHAQKVLMPSGSNACGGIWQQLSVPVGKRIRITAWQYKDYSGTDWYVLSTIGVDRNGGTQWDYPYVFEAEASVTNYTWTKASITVRSDTGTLTLWLRTLFKYDVGGSATIWWDEVTVEDVGPTPIPTAQPAAHDGWPRFEELPYPKDGIIAGQFSSRDHSGGNADGCAYAPLGSEEGYVLIDMKGPGAITDMWQTGLHPSEQIKFTFDDQQDSEIDSPVLEFFNGECCRWIDEEVEPWTQYQVYPYINPLNRGYLDAGGGYVSNFIFPFQERARVTQLNRGCYFITSFHKYKPGTETTTYDFDLYGGEVEYQSWVFEDPTVDPKSTSGNQVTQGTLNLSPGQTGQLASINGSGYIAAIKVDPSPNTRSAIQNAWLEIRFDGRAPSVFAPLGRFFGCGYDERNVRGLGVGMSTSGYYYCYYPMPFWESATVRIVNQGSQSMTIPYQVHWNSAAYESHACYFTAGMHWGNVIGIDGSGTYLGCVCTINGNTSYNRSYLEGDERINLDGDHWVTHLGTGTEDFFHGGWYYDDTGEFSNATHGCPFIALDENDRDLHSQYRLRPLDFIPFRRSFVLNLEPLQPDVTVSFLAYSYQRPVVSMEQTDSLNVGDANSESAHNYTVQGQTWSGSFASSFEGADSQQYTFSGRAFTGYSQFNAAIQSDNDGVLLRRCLDHGTAGQEANVYVDSQLVGRWYTYDKNEVLRWFEDSFMIPRQYTAGKSTITIRIQNADPQPAWTEFYYDIFSIYHTNTNDVHLEAEDQSGTQTSGQAAYSESVSAWDSRWSNDRHLRFAATGTGQWVQWPISIPTTGRYFVKTGVTGNYHYGIGRMSIDGGNVGNDIDMYRASLGRKEEHMGTVSLTGGSHTVRFTVVGKAGASSGYQLGIDCLDFNRILTEPLPTETPWIPGTPQPTPTPGTPTSTPTVTETPSVPDEALVNGSFEDGFTGGVANGWTEFRSSGYSAPLSDGTDQYLDGTHSQKLTMLQPPFSNAYVGIYQRAEVQPAATYDLLAHARNHFGGSEPWNHLVARLGVDLTGGTDFTSGSVTWTEFSTEVGVWHEIEQEIVPTGNYVTIFLEGWRKWAAGGSDAAIWFDVVCLTRQGGGPPPTSTPEPTDTPQSGQGLLNGDMEGGFTNGVANEWASFCTNGNPTFSDGTDQKHDGSHSQKIVYPQPSGGGYAGIYQVVSCSSGQNGTLTAWKYDITGGGPWDIVCRLGYDLTGGTNPEGGSVVWTEFDCTPHGTWLSCQVQFTTTGNSVAVFVEVWHKGWGGTHTAWFDDVTLDGVGGPAPTPTPTSTPSSGGLLNGDMEGGFTSGVANSWTSYCTNGNPTFSDGTDQKHGGAHSQKIVYPQPSGQGFAGIYQVVNCSPSQNGTLTAWKYDITGGGPWDIVCRLGYDLTGGTDPQAGSVVWTEFDCTPHETWLSRQVEFTTTGNSITVFVEAWHKGWGGTHTVWLDDVTLDGVGGV